MGERKKGKTPPDNTINDLKHSELSFVRIQIESLSFHTRFFHGTPFHIILLQFSPGRFLSLFCDRMERIWAIYGLRRAHGAGHGRLNTIGKITRD